MNDSVRKSSNTGFTLIELAIVITVIGLAVSGILVAQDMIRAAELRKIITEVEKYATAINTFEVKYGCLPGDCPYATRFGALENGNGDARINSYFPNPAGSGIPYFQQTVINAVDDVGDGSQLEEVSLLNEHLAFAGLIALAPFDRRVAPPPFVTTNKWYINVGYDTWTLFALTDFYGKNIIRFGGKQEAPSGFGASVLDYAYGINGSGESGGGILDPVRAMQIDSKVDDGLPWTGQVVEEHLIGMLEWDFSTIGQADTLDLCNYFKPGTNTSINQYNVTEQGNATNSYLALTYGGLPCALEFYGKF